MKLELELGILSLIFFWHSIYYCYTFSFCSFRISSYTRCSWSRNNHILYSNCIFMAYLFGLLSFYYYVLLYQFVAHSMQFSIIIIVIGVVVCSRQFLSFSPSSPSVLLSQKIPKNNWIFVVHHNNRSTFLCENFIVLLSLYDIYFSISLIPFQFSMLDFICCCLLKVLTQWTELKTKYREFYFVHMETTNFYII